MISAPGRVVRCNAVSDDSAQADAATDAARRRVEEFLAAVERTSVDDLLMVALPLPDPASRARREQKINCAAAIAGRDNLLAEARSRTGALLERGFARRAYEPTWFGLNRGRSLGRSTDRAALFAATDDAAAARVVEDLLEPGLVEDLSWRFEAAAAMRGTAPATNPIVSSPRVGSGRRFVLVVLIAITAGWLLVAEFIATILAWIEPNPPQILF